VALLVLVGLLVVVDRVALAVAERAAAVTLQQSQHLTHRPSVSIDGFPFLTQLAAGDFDRIRVTAKDLRVGEVGNTVRIARLNIALRHVDVSRDFSHGHSEFSTATALITYPDLSAALDTRLSYAGAGRVKATQTATVAGVPVSATATAGVRVSGDALTFTDPQVSVEGQAVPPAVADSFAALFGTSIPLTGLPFGTRVRSVRADASGVTITLTAADLTFHR
jgi:hypothetical protein